MLRPDDRQWQTVLDELDSLVDQLHEFSFQARARRESAGRDGYPTTSLPENSSVASGRRGDPTATAVLHSAGGKDEQRDGFGNLVREATPDTWPTPYDPINAAVNNMEREADDAKNRLRGAVASMRKALPQTIPDPEREQCTDCFVPKSVATKHGNYPRGWVAATARCEACNRRHNRQTSGQ